MWIVDDGTECSPPPQEMMVEKIIYHQSYGKPNPFQNDIAIIVLTKNVTINDYVSLICLPFLDDDEIYSRTRFGEDILETTVAGWGATTGERLTNQNNKMFPCAGTGRNKATKLQYLDVNVTDSDMCRLVIKFYGKYISCYFVSKGNIRKSWWSVDWKSDLCRRTGEFIASYWLGESSYWLGWTRQLCRGQWQCSHEGDQDT